MKKSLSIMVFLGLMTVGILHGFDKKGESTEKIFKPNTYEGVAKGFGGPINVKVTTSDTKIENISIVNHQETPNIAANALNDIPKAIIEHQSVAVDSISGVTKTSDGIKNAVVNALLKSGAGISTFSKEIAKNVENKTDEVKDTVVDTTKNVVDKTGDKVGEVKDAVVNTAKDVAGKVEDKIEEIKKEVGALFAQGKYTAEGTGYGGPIKVEVTTTDNKIEDIKILEHSETESIAAAALTDLPKAIIANQSITVDTISGATKTSEGIITGVTAALTKAGANLKDISKAAVITSATPKVEVKDTITDIVVVGGGGAGLTAAITAKEKGLNVILLDKMPMLGGNTTFATGGMNAANTELQKKLKIEDSEELFYQDTMKGGKDKNNPELLKVMTDRAKDMVPWLVERGMDLSEVSVSGGASVKRIHRPTGGKAVGPVLVDALNKKAQSLGIDIRLDSKVVGLIKEGNKVVGVEVEHGGQNYKINSKAVVMATGGFGANPEMIAEANPDFKGFGSTNSKAITGEGIKMVKAAGGALVDMELIQTHPTVVHENTVMITESVRGEGAILVNREGKRFINELDTRDVVSKAVLAQKEGSAFLIFDQQVRDNLKAIENYVKQGHAKEGKTLEELAKAMGIDEKELPKTVAAFNAAVKAKEDKIFGNKTLKLELTKAPFYAIEISPAIHHTMGGVKINTNTEVLDDSGKGIDGLFAAGEITGGIHGANRIGGNAVADIIVFGKIAGDNAADYAKIGPEAYHAAKEKEAKKAEEAKKLEEKKEEVKEEIKDAAKKVEDKAVEVKDAVVDAAKKAEDKAVDAKDAIVVTSKKAADEVVDAKDTAVEKSKEIVEKVEEKAIDAKDAVVDTSKNVAEKVEDQIKEIKKKIGALFASGKFTAEGTGFGGPIKVEVVTSDNKIEDIKILEHSETESIAAAALKDLPKAIITNQSIKVDTISGATKTSQGIIDAVTNALKKAGANLNELGKAIADASETKKDEEKTATAKKEEEIKQKLKNNKDNVNFSLSGDVSFDKNSDQIKTNFHGLLDHIANHLTENPNTKITITGHTDSDGKASYNKALSEARAFKIKEYLVSKGIDASRIKARGYGESKPLVPNRGSANKAKNRRVEIDIRK